MTTCWFEIAVAMPCFLLVALNPSLLSLPTSA